MKVRSVIGVVVALMLAACSEPAAPAVPADSTPRTPDVTSAPSTTGTTSVSTSALPTSNADASPEARSGHDLVYHDGLGMVLLVNGDQALDPGERAAQRVWGWDGSAWREIGDAGPSLRSLGGVAYDTRRDRLVLYGGGTSPECETDTWEWDRQRWERKDVLPAGICDHLAMVYDAARAVVVTVGGQAPGVMLQAGTWQWDGRAWTQVAPGEPPARVHYAIAYDSTRERVVLFGGRTGGRRLGDTWEWDGAVWHEMPTTGGPTPREGARMAFDMAAGEVVLFGGGPRPLADTWTWDGTAWSNAADGGPPPRAYHAMAYDAARQKVVMFGGYDGHDNRADTWEWDGASWSCVAACD